MVVLTPEPVVVVPPGVLVSVHVPLAGRPLIITLPVVTAQVGCVIVPITGAVGVRGAVAITTLAEAREIQPDALATV